jgi:Uma2 family endonuclease
VAPWLVVEVVSAGAQNARRDRVEKLRDYRACGVRHYWLLDPQARMLEALELREDGTNVVALAVTDGTHTAPGCEGLTLPLDELWAELDRLPSDPPGEDA